METQTLCELIKLQYVEPVCGGREIDDVIHGISLKSSRARSLTSEVCETGRLIAMSLQDSGSSSSGVQGADFFVSALSRHLQL